MLFKFSLVALISSAVMARAFAPNAIERANLAQVITSCVKPQTAALTFDDVCLIGLLLFFSNMFLISFVHRRAPTYISTCVQSSFRQLLLQILLTYIFIITGHI